MFGTLKPHGCTMGDGLEAEYRLFYCGLCQGLGRRFGPLSRGVLSRDAVFVAVLADGLLEQPASPSSCRCPMMPIHRKPTASGDSVPLRFAAGIQMLLGDQWLADREADGNRSARLARSLAARPVATAREELTQLGVSLEPLEGFEHRQSAVEEGDATPEQAAAPTAEALGLVFGSLADLPGAGDGLRQPAVRDDLQQLGQHVGRVIYLADALEDLRRDYLRGQFNPCVVGGDDGRRIVPGRVRSACRSLRSARQGIAEILPRLPWRRHRQVVENILCDRLAGTARTSSSRARHWSSPEGIEELRDWQAQPWHARSLVALLAVCVTLWGRAATAATSIAHRLLRIEEEETTPEDDGGGGGGGGGDGGDGGGSSGCDTCDEINQAIKDLIDACFGSISGCCGACSGCEDSTKGCCDGCTGCCDSCSDCGDCCNDCDDCGDCCNDCDDCGNCCDGCNDCGNCNC